ncbi:chemokine XC receptor 1-like [Triplophysa dalaica]|uniref:chemokine XC receptor 1-like n=1 Tax=Triplophysa dalaica TaxID=1582913 RepID=UPI0024E038DA|nr:chemokine XC receptor 1-like [Triplophysa dalaica]
MKNSTVNFTTSEASFESSDVLLRLQMSVYSINVLFGLPTHSFIIWLIITGTGSGIPSDFFILNLSVCEIGICLNSVITLFLYYFSISNLLGLINFLIGLSITGRPLFQCLICVERYLAVVHPVTFLKYKPLRYRIMCCTAAWIINLASCLCMFGIISSNIVFFVKCYSIQFLIFLSIQLFCCLAVLRALKQSGPGEKGREREEENHMKRRAFHLILITAVNLVVTYLPFTISGFYYGLSKQYILELFTFSFHLFIFGGFVQPFLYLHRAGKLCFLCSP